MKQHMCDIGINMKPIDVQRLPSLWYLKFGTFNFDLQLLCKKSELAPHIFISKYNKLVSEHKNYLHIFTDAGASKGLLNTPKAYTNS